MESCLNDEITLEFLLGATLTDMDEDGEKLADITLVQPQDDQHGQQVIQMAFVCFHWTWIAFIELRFKKLIN